MRSAHLLKRKMKTALYPDDDDEGRRVVDLRDLRPHGKLFALARLMLTSSGARFFLLFNLAC